MQMTEMEVWRAKAGGGNGLEKKGENTFLDRHPNRKRDEIYRYFIKKKYKWPINQREGACCQWLLGKCQQKPQENTPAHPPEWLPWKRLTVPSAGRVEVPWESQTRSDQEEWLFANCLPGPTATNRANLWLISPTPSSVPEMCLVARSCLTRSDTMDCSTQGRPVHHQLPELAQTHVHWVGDAIRPSHPLLSPSPAFNVSQQQGLFQWVISSHQVAKLLEFQL